MTGAQSTIETQSQNRASACSHSLSAQGRQSKVRFDSFPESKRIALFVLLF